MADVINAAVAAAPQRKVAKPADTKVKVSFESEGQLTRVASVLRSALGLAADWEPVIGRGHANLWSKGLRALDPEAAAPHDRLVLAPRDAATPAVQVTLY